MESTLHLVRMAKAIWLVKQSTLQRWLMGLVVLSGLVLVQSALAQGPRFSIGGSGDFGDYGPDRGAWLEVSKYSLNPDQPEIWARGAIRGSWFLVGLRSRQAVGSIETTVGMGFGLDNRDTKKYQQQTDPISTLVEVMFLVGVVKVMRTEVNLGLEFPLNQQLGINVEGYASGSIIGGLSYGFRSGLSLTLGK